MSRIQNMKLAIWVTLVFSVLTVNLNAQRRLDITVSGTSLQPGISPSLSLTKGQNCGSSYLKWVEFYVEIDFGKDWITKSNVIETASLTFDVISVIDGAETILVEDVELVASNADASNDYDQYKVPAARWRYRNSDLVGPLSGIKIRTSADANIPDDLECRIGLLAEHGVDPNIVTIGSPMCVEQPTESGKYNFSWSSNHSCSVVSDNIQYELQVMRVFEEFQLDQNDNWTPVDPTLDWSGAFTILVGNTDKTLTLAEGKGTYVWRVRTVGNLFGYPESDRRNFGGWSTGNALTLDSHPSAYKFTVSTEIESDKNWAYQRVITENGHIKEQISYSNGLNHPVQSQILVASKNLKVATQSILDFEGRPAIATLSTPIDNSGLGYEESLASNDNNEPYNASDFDGPKLFDPQPMRGLVHDYYDGDNLWHDQVNTLDEFIPSAERRPYSQMTYYTDGTNRVHKGAGPGDAHWINSGHAIQNLMGTVSQDELNYLFADEAPNAATVLKNFTIDPNGQSSVTLTNIQGQVIATYLSGATVPSSLKSVTDPVPASFSITQSIEDSYSDLSTIIGSKTISFPEGNVELTIDHSLSQPVVEFLCDQAAKCATCDYDLEIVISRMDNPNDNSYPTVIYGLADVQSSISDELGGCSSSPITTTQSVQYTVASAGVYNISKVLKVNREDAFGIPFSKKYASQVNADILDFFQGNTAYQQLLSDLQNDEISIADLTDPSTGNTSQYINYLQVDGNNKWVGISVPGQGSAGCCDINIQVDKCVETVFDPNQPYAFTDYLITVWGTTHGTDLKHYFRYNGGDYFGAKTSTEIESLFDELITNMQSDGLDLNDAAECWVGLVDAYEIVAFDGETYTNQAPLNAYNLFEQFIECTDPAYEGAVTTVDQYLPYAYKYIWLDVATTNCDETIEEDEGPMSGWGIDKTIEEISSLSISGPDDMTGYRTWSALKACAMGEEVDPSDMGIEPPCPGLAPGTQTNDLDFILCAESWARDLEESCLTSCEEKRDAFEEALIKDYIAFDNQVDRVSEIPSSGWEQIHCLTERVIEECVKNCNVSLEFDGNGYMTSMGSEEEIEAIQRVLTYDFEIEADWDQSGLSCPYNVDHMNVAISVGYEYTKANQSWVMNGHAKLNEDDCNCYDLTDFEYLNAGSIFYPEPLNLNEPFSYRFDLQTEGSNLSGMNFILHTGGTTFTEKTSILGDPGARHGYGKFNADVPNTVSVEFDLYPNSLYTPNMHDPSAQHMAYLINGRTDHDDPIYNGQNIYLDIPSSTLNLKDGEKHEVLVKWTPANNQLLVIIDEGRVNSQMLTVNRDIRNDIQGDITEAYMGWSGSTGGGLGVHRVCHRFPRSTCEMTPNCDALEDWNYNPSNVSQLDCNCFELTDGTVSGENSMIRRKKLNLRAPFDETFELTFGELATGGRGIGFDFMSVVNSENIYVHFDTYQHTAVGDGPEDQMSIENVSENELDDIFEQLPFELEDGRTYDVRIVYEPHYYAMGQQNALLEVFITDGIQTAEVCKYFDLTVVSGGGGHYTNALIERLGDEVQFRVFGQTNTSEGANRQTFCHNMPTDFPNQTESVGVCTSACLSWIAPTETDWSESGLEVIYEEPSCDKEVKRRAYLNLIEQVASSANNQAKIAEAAYIQTCTSPELFNESLSVSYEISSYQHTLFYYDRSGNLVKTVAPEGVKGDHVISQPETHDYETKYKYNSIGQTLYQSSPDGGESFYKYDRLGRLLYSRNSQQLADNKISFTEYDKLSRVIRSGEANYSGVNMPEDQASKVFAASDILSTVQVVYDISSNITYQGRPQRFVQNRIAQTTRTDVVNNNSSSTYYSYDAHGNVEWVMRDLPLIGKIFVGYEYDLLSGNIKQVNYNEGRADQFYHRYEYDEDNRLVKVETSIDGANWEKDATYEYYAHGPVKRTEIGENDLQGLDYIYNINGWLKAINHPERNKDPGNDSRESNGVSADAFGMSLNYFNGDYINDNDLYASTSMGVSPTTSDPMGQGRELFNGNITSWVKRVYEEENFLPKPKTVVSTYEYDQLHRIRSSREGELDESTGLYSNLAHDQNVSQFATNYHYDLNGNLLQTERNSGQDASQTGTHEQIDDFTYIYEGQTAQFNGTSNRFEASGEAVSNKLIRVIDNIEGDHGGDLFTVSGNTDEYLYDLRGNLIYDPIEDLTISWTVDGKVQKIIKHAGGTPTNASEITFAYDETGNRISKTVTYSDREVYTVYARDPSGNPMSIYEGTDVFGTGFGGMYLKEQPLYGSSRLGARKVNLPVTQAATLPKTEGAQERVAEVEWDVMQTQKMTMIAGPSTNHNVYSLQHQQDQEVINQVAENSFNWGPSVVSYEDERGVMRFYGMVGDRQTTFFNARNEVIGLIDRGYGEGQIMRVPGFQNEYFYFTIDKYQVFRVRMRIENDQVTKLDEDVILGVPWSTSARAAYYQIMLVEIQPWDEYYLYLNKLSGVAPGGEIYTNSTIEKYDVGGAEISLVASSPIFDNSNFSIFERGGMAMHSDAEEIAVGFSKVSGGPISGVYAGEVRVFESEDLSLIGSHTFLHSTLQGLTYGVNASTTNLYVSRSSKWSSNILKVSRIDDSRVQLVSGRADRLVIGENGNIYCLSPNGDRPALKIINPDYENNPVVETIGAFGGSPSIPPYRVVEIPTENYEFEAPLTQEYYYYPVHNDKVYELTDHLGNVRVVIGERLQGGAIVYHEDFDASGSGWPGLNTSGGFMEVPTSMTVPSGYGKVFETEPGKEYVVRALVHSTSTGVMHVGVNYQEPNPDYPPVPFNFTTPEYLYPQYEYSEMIGVNNSPSVVEYTFLADADVHEIELVWWDNSDTYDLLVDWIELEQVSDVEVEILAAHDYYPFGMVMPGRSYTSEGYRYGFNGYEKDDELSGDGNSLNFGARMYDSRLGRFRSIDPWSKVFPDKGPYSFAVNSPIQYVDEGGNGPFRRFNYWLLRQTAELTNSSVSAYVTAGASIPGAALSGSSGMAVDPKGNVFIYNTSGGLAAALKDLEESWTGTNFNSSSGVSAGVGVQIMPRLEKLDDLAGQGYEGKVSIELEVVPVYFAGTEVLIGGNGGHPVGWGIEFGASKSMDPVSALVPFSVSKNMTYSTGLFLSSLDFYKYDAAMDKAKEQASDMPIILSQNSDFYKYGSWSFTGTNTSYVEVSEGRYEMVITNRYFYSFNSAGIEEFGEYSPNYANSTLFHPIHTGIFFELDENGQYVSESYKERTTDSGDSCD